MRHQVFGAVRRLRAAAFMLLASALSIGPTLAAGPSPNSEGPVPDPTLEARLSPSDPAQQELVRRLRGAVLAVLKADPDSARFRGEFLSRPEDPRSTVRSLCGRVSATAGSGRGGDPVFVAFVANSAGLVSIESSDSSAFQRYVWPAWCSNPT